MTNCKEILSYRWIIEILFVLTLFSETSAWLAPAPILSPMIKDLDISLGSAGLIISVIALCIGIFSMLGALALERMGVLAAILMGIWVLAVSEILSGYCTTFSSLMVCRVFEGIGHGVVMGPSGAILMQWFGEKEWPYINMVNSVFSFGGVTLLFSITVPMFVALGSSWNLVLRYYGLFCATVALMWTILGRERRVPLEERATTDTGHTSVIAEVTKMRDVTLIAIALFGSMWVFQLYAGFLPQFFREYRGLGLTQASAMTAVLPTAGMFAALLGGLGTGLTGLRKPFLWPVVTGMLFGCAGAVIFSDPVLIELSLVLVGIGVAGWGAAILTLIMELPAMTPEKMGIALAFIWSTGYAGAFASPFLGGVMAEVVGLRTVMLGSLCLLLLPIVAFYLLPETGPGRQQIRLAAAS
jgi:predicted MFS family arabinose efflux permease